MASNSDPAKLPRAQILVVLLVQLVESLQVNVLFPFLPWMIADLGHGGVQLGVYAGALAAAFCGAQFCTSVAWGTLSDRYGRRPAIVLGTAGAMVGGLVFGFSSNYTQAVVGRVISGGLSGNLGVLKVRSRSTFPPPLLTHPTTHPTPH